MKVNFGEMEDKIRQGRIRRISKEVLGIVQDVAGKKKFVVEFEDGQKKEMSSSSLSCVSQKQDFDEEVDKTTSDIPKIVQGELLNINGGPFCEGDGTLGKVIQLSIYYCFFVEAI